MAKFAELDTGSTLEVTCKNDADSSLIDLTGATVKLLYTIARKALETKTMTLDADPKTGKATYKFLTGDLERGEFRGEVEIKDSSEEIITSLNLLVFQIRPRLV